VVDGVTSGRAAKGVTVSSALGALAVVSVDLSTLGLDGKPAEILFRLVGGTDPSTSSTVTLSDVLVKSNSGPVVPEPSTFLLAGLGILGWLGYALIVQGRPIAATAAAGSLN
jgi:hypothetical protein